MPLIISATHTGKLYGALLTILDRTRDNIMHVMGSAFTEKVSQEKNKEDYHALQLMKQPYDEKRFAYALWNLINIFYSAASVYKVGDDSEDTLKKMTFFGTFAYHGLSLQHNMLLMVTPDSFSKTAKLTAKENYLGFKKGIRVSNDTMFQLGVILANLLIEINPKSYPSSAEEPNMTSLFGYIAKSPDWHERMQKLPGIITNNLKAYFATLPQPQQIALLNKLPNYSLVVCVKPTTFMSKKEALLSDSEGTETTTKDLFSDSEGTTTTDLFTDSEGTKTTTKVLFSGSEGAKTTTKDLFSGSEGTKTTSNLFRSAEASNQSSSETVGLHTNKAVKKPKTKKASELERKWDTLHKKYFDATVPTSRFPSCVNGYANSLYTLFETFLAYLWLKAGYQYGETRQQRRQTVMSKLTEKSSRICALLKQYDFLSNAANSKQVTSESAKHPFFISPERASSRLQTVICQLTQEWSALSHHIDKAKPQFSGLFHDKILDCLNDLNKDVENLRNKLTKKMPKLEQDSDEYGAQQKHLNWLG